MIGPDAHSAHASASVRPTFDSSEQGSSVAGTGDVIAGRYRLVTRLGAGGMGVVWTARDEAVDRTVALKQVHLSSFAPGEGSDRGRALLRSEATTAARLVHPNIVRVHESVEHDGEPWLVMEFVPGRDLARLLAEEGPLPPRRAARIGAQVAAALAHAHAETVVHRDVTPRNILVGDDDHAKLTDFGISRVGDATLAGTAPAQGVPAYYAPEVANGVRPGPRSDVFALGAVLYAAVEGTPPWGTGSESEIMDRAAQGLVPPPARAGRHLSRVLTRMLRKQPRHRPHAPEVEQLLHRAAAGRVSRDRVVAAVAAALAVVVGLGVVLWPDQAAAVARIADERTADPCALIRTGPFDRFGDTALETDYGAFNRCDVIMDSDTTRFGARIQFERASAVLPDAPVENRGDLVVIRQPRDDDQCVRRIRLPDAHEVLAVATAMRGDTPELCAIADIATDGALAVLERGPVPERPSPFPDTSLATVDTCAVLDAATIATVPGLADAAPEPGYGSWECEWERTDSAASVIVRYDRDEGDFNEDDGAPVRIGDRDAAIDPTDDGECEITVRHRRYLDPAGYLSEERLVVEVVQPTPVADPCAPALPVAAVAVGNLPPPE